MWRYRLPCVIALVAANALAGGLMAQAPPTARTPGETHLLPVRLPEFKPPTLAQDVVTVNLPGAVRATAIGGGGRYLVLQMAGPKRLGIFDVSAAKFTQAITLESDDVDFAASAEKLVVLVRDQHLLQRWNLVTAQLELTKKLDPKSKIYTVAMGSASNGPVLIAGGERAVQVQQLLDLETLEPAAIVMRSGYWSVSGGTDCVVRASANGRVFAMHQHAYGTTYVQALAIDSNSAACHSEHETVADIWPSADGRFLYTDKRVYNNDARQVGKYSPKNGIPSVLGNFYLVPDFKSSGNVTLHVAGDARTLASLPGVFPAPENPQERGATAAEVSIERLLLIPAMNVIVTLPYSNDRLLLRRFNVQEEIDKGGVDYLFVTSTPATRIKPGQAYEYTVQARAKRGGLKYQLAAGPAGMKISSAGTITWTAPADVAARNTVVVSVKDAAGQEIYQNFAIEIGNQPVVEDPRPGRKRVTAAASEPAAASAPPAAPSASPVVSLPKIEPITLKDDETPIKLPAPLGEVAPAGGGRFLLLHLPSLRQLAVFDICQAKVIKYLALSSDDVAFTGGADRIIVALRDKRLLQRFNLNTFELELTVDMPVTDVVATVTMGHASSGPVMLLTLPARTSSGTDLKFLDGNTLSVLKVDFGLNRFKQNRLTLWTKNYFPRASSNGRLFMVGTDGLQIDGLKVEQKWAKGQEIDSYAMPSTDGSLLYSVMGFYDNNLSLRGTQMPGGVLLPALQPGYYLKLADIKAWDRNANPPISPVTVYTEGDTLPLFSIKFPVWQSVVEQNSSPEPIFIHRRIYYLPEANALVQLPASNDQLVVYKVEIDRELARAEHDYLFVESRPPQSAVAGQALEYQLRVKSKRGGVKFELSAPIKGMSISSTGLLQWTVPADFSSQRQEVVVGIKDGSGQEIFHTFPIAIASAAAPAQPKVDLATIPAVPDVSNGIAQRAMQAKKSAETSARHFLERLPEPPLPPQPSRLWTDVYGNEVHASYVQCFTGFVTLQKEQNVELMALLNHLSPADQDYVRRFTAAAVARRQARDALQNQPETLALNVLRMIGAAHHTAITSAKQRINLYSYNNKGEPLLSWRVNLLPHFGGQELYDLFRKDEPWDSEHNKQLIKYMPDFYRAYGSNAGEGLTNFVALDGPECFFNGPYLMGARKVPDGAAKTVTIVEAPDDQAVIWTKPADYPYAAGVPVRRIFGMRKGGLNVLMLDGNPRLISAANTDETLQWLFSRGDERVMEVK